MKRLTILGAVVGTLLLFAFIGSGQSSKVDTVQTNKITNTAANIPQKDTPTCDGTTVTSSCISDGVNYKTYIYHPAVSEKTHAETVTTYHKEVTGYCTLCNDGTYSPSCATGRGACSYHGGVAEWNAPVWSNVPTTSTKTVIDEPAQDAFYEKVTQ